MELKCSISFPYVPFDKRACEQKAEKAKGIEKPSGKGPVRLLVTCRAILERVHGHIDSGGG